MKTTKEKRAMASKIARMRHELMSMGLYRTGRLIEIAEQEIGWELQGVKTPKEQQKRQMEILNP